MKKVFLFASAAVALLATGCSNDLMTDNSAVDNTGKEKILFSAGDGETVFQTRAGFANSTRIVARIVSESRGSEAAKCVKTVLSATEQVTSKDYSDVAYASDDYVRYWDDAHGRNSKLSVYAVAIPNKVSYTKDAVTKYYIDESKLFGGDTWGTENTDANTIAWEVSATQTTDILANEDLAYSNNIQEGNVGGNSVYTWDYENGKYPEKGEANAIKHTYGTDPVVTDGRLYFTQEGKTVNEALTTDPGHFDRGQMEFKHALSRIRVNLIHGEGYTSTISLTGNLQLNNMPSKGTLDIKEGTWTLAASDGTSNVNMTQVATMTAKDLTYEAQVLPGYVFADDDVNAMQFTISNNTYYITNKMLRAALKDKTGVTADYNMLQGNRYIFDITVAKSKIQKITATIVPWNDITAENMIVDNSHVTFSFYNNGNKCTDVKLYKNTQSLGDGVISTDNTYSADPVVGAAYANVELVGSAAPYSTNEFYNDNNTAYHFRSLNTVSEGALNADKTAFTMTSGNDDYHWGAPMLPTTLTAIPYSSETGYSSTIAKGIVAADKNSNIVLTEIHMMSQLVIKLTTPEVGGVDLENAEVYLTKYYADGTVDMSFGKITPATMTDKSSKFTAAASPATDTYVFNVVPQELKRGTGANDSDYIGITIKTKDNNEYYIVKRLSEILATSVGSEVTNLQTKDAKITTWYPGHRYTYTFNIKKKEIEVITATIVPWNDVTGANTNLDLEK